MRRAAVLLVLGAVAAAGCGGGEPTRAERVRKQVESATERLHERVKKEGAERVDEADKALLRIERSDLPADVKQQLLEAKELLDKYEPEAP